MTDLILRKVYNLSFNNNHTNFIICTDVGTMVFGINQKLVEMRHFKIDEWGPLGIGEMLYTSNFHFFVGLGKLNENKETTATFWNAHKKASPFKLTFPDKILNIKMNNSRVVFILKEAIYIGVITEFPTEIYCTIGTIPNPLGLGVITPQYQAKRNILCFPSKTMGSIGVIDLDEKCTDETVKIRDITAHQGNIACMSLNQNGSLLATASQQGTIIRIWDPFTGKRKYEFRRGMDSAIIYSINFHHENTYLICSSDKGTAHIFDLKNANKKKRLTLKQLALPLDGTTSVAKFKIPKDFKTICAFGTSNVAFAVAYNGTVSRHTYVIDEETWKFTDEFYSLQNVCKHDIKSIFDDTPTRQK